MKLLYRAGRTLGQNGFGFAATLKILPPPGVISDVARLSFDPCFLRRFAQPFFAAERWPAALPNHALSLVLRPRRRLMGGFMSANIIASLFDSSGDVCDLSSFALRTYCSFFDRIFGDADWIFQVFASLVSPLRMQNLRLDRHRSPC